MLIISLYLCHSPDGFGHSFFYNLRTGLITYRNTIAPKNGGKRFPEDYFEERQCKLNPEENHKLQELVLHKVWKIPLIPYFIHLLKPIQKGAYDEACLIVKLPFGSFSYYGDVTPTFLELVNALEAHCDFPYGFPPEPTTPIIFPPDL